MLVGIVTSRQIIGVPVVRGADHETVVEMVGLSDAGKRAVEEPP